MRQTNIRITFLVVLIISALLSTGCAQLFRSTAEDEQAAAQAGQATPQQEQQPGDANVQAQPGAQGAQGLKGDKGDKGDPGQALTDAQIQAAIAAYVKANPLPAGQAPTADQIKTAVETYLKANPPQAGTSPTADQIKSTVDEYLKKNPPQAGATDAQVKAALDAYFKANPVKDGQAPTEAQLQAAVKAYLDKNPPKTGPAPTDAQVKTAFDEYVKTHPLTSMVTGSGGGCPQGTYPKPNEKGGIGCEPVTPEAGDTTPGTPSLTDNFNPYHGYEQSCGPEKNPLGGCIWDVGTKGSHTDVLNREVVEVGIVKGVSIQWARKVANSSPNKRCALVVLTSNSWFENLTIKDANVTVFKIWPKDIPGWTKTLAIQAAAEQQLDYDCPAKSYPQDIEHWSSSVKSPPCGTPGFANCTPGASTGTSGARAQGQSGSAGASPQGGTGQAASPACDTVDCKQRMATVDHGGSLRFSAGDAVTGFRITLDGQQSVGDCRYDSAPGDGTVVDGVVHPWHTEAARHRPC